MKGIVLQMLAVHAFSRKFRRFNVLKYSHTMSIGYKIFVKKEFEK